MMQTGACFGVSPVVNVNGAFPSTHQDDRCPNFSPIPAPDAS